jgi:hypothetical protein
MAVLCSLFCLLTNVESDLMLFDIMIVLVLHCMLQVHSDHTAAAGCEVPLLQAAQVALLYAGLLLCNTLVLHVPAVCVPTVMHGPQGERFLPYQ